jgi:hypothetical protein
LGKLASCFVVSVRPLLVVNYLLLRTRWQTDVKLPLVQQTAVMRRGSFLVPILRVTNITNMAAVRTFEILKMAAFVFYAIHTVHFSTVRIFTVF